MRDRPVPTAPLVTAAFDLALVPASSTWVTVLFSPHDDPLEVHDLITVRHR